MSHSPNHQYLIALSRACGGAALFSLPMLMTMEMWWLGLYISPVRLALLITLAVPVLTGVAYYSGFEHRVTWRGALVDAMVAFVVGVVTSTCVLLLFAVLDFSQSPMEWLGKITLQAIPAGLGAVLASSQLGQASTGDETNAVDQEQQQSKTSVLLSAADSELEIESTPDDGQESVMPSYSRELFLMLTGSLYLEFNMAPTEEMTLIAYKMSPWHALALILVSLACMHAFVYVVQFRGQEAVPKGQHWIRAFTRFTIVGYALVLLVSWYCLWTFGRTDQHSLDQILMMSVVLAFPGALGAAAARLIL